MSSFAFETNLSKRRVPDSARRRTLVSCDRCKTRRIRCARPNPEESCEPCQKSRVLCNTLIPRKRMRYADTDTLDLRCKALDALVRGMFPNEDCGDIQTLFRLGVERNISMPDRDQASSNLDCPEGITSWPSEGTQTTVAVPTSYSAASLSQANLERPPPTNQSPQSSVAVDLPWPYNIDPAVQGAVINLPEETCIPAPHGIAHYVGPASSFEFAAAVRRLVIARSETLGDARTRQDRRSKLRADFANLKTSIALEPRIQAHPASTVREQTNEELVNVSSSNPTAYHAKVVENEGQIDKRSGTSSRTSLRALLPTREISENLIKAFFDRLHPNYVLFHRGTFHTRYESIWQRSPVYRGDHDPGWLCSLFMVYVFGAQLLEQANLEDAAGLQRKFLRLVRERFHHLALTASLANVQVLLLLQLYEHNAGERNTAWILLGQAARMAIALGMHREGTGHNFDAIERNTRRLVWFTLYSFEQHSSLALGRPSTIKALEVNIRLPDEAVVDGNDHPPDYFTHASTLLDLASKVRHFATAASPNCFDDQFLTSMLDSLAMITQELRSWSRRLPRHLCPEWSFISLRHLRAVLLLHINYHYIFSVLTRPYLLCKVSQDIKHQNVPGSSSPTTAGHGVSECAQKCITSSIAVADLLHRLASDSLLEGSGWTDFFYLYHAMLVLGLDFLGRPNLSSDEWTVQDREISASVSMLMEMCQSHQLGPTYRILSKVAIQFAHIVGLAGDYGQSRAESERMPDTQASQDQSGREPFRESTNPLSIGTATANQHDMFMPFAEPISDITQYNDDHAFWDFFNVNGVNELDMSFNPSMQYMASSFQDPFAHLPGNDGSNTWHS